MNDIASSRPADTVPRDAPDEPDKHQQELKRLLTRSLDKVEKWVEDHDYKGYEPFDGLSSSLRPLTFGNLFLDRLLLQAVRQSPFNLRPLLGIKPQESTKGQGYMAWGYLTRFKTTGMDPYAQKAIKCFRWLMKNKSPKYESYSWGNHFDFASRGGRYSKHEPIIVWTALIGQAFLEGFEVLEDEEYLDVAVSICDWILALPREKTGTGNCISYLALDQSSIHNSNMLGAAMLARTFKHTGNIELCDVAHEAMKYSCTRQLPNGAWWYGEDPRYHWIDNFHTGYNLDSLKCYIDSTDDLTWEDNLKQSLRFYCKNFFEPDGTPKYYHNKTQPIDIQCVAQSIETLTNFSKGKPGYLNKALAVASWAIAKMQDRKGYFYFRLYPVIKSKTPMLHWGQTTMHRALALLLSKSLGDC